MSTYFRHRVSQNRHRYIKDNFDLDLTYIEPNIIAMGYPSDRMLPGLVRNQIDDVTDFLKLRHDGAYKVYNLCDKPYYNLKHFEKVEVVPMQDHNPPKFYQIETFCRSVREWLTAKPTNVVIVHCKAGKGRTGTMISCYLLFAKKFESPFDAMSYFDSKRCQDKKGVTIPSQRRYIEYYADLLKNNREYASEELLLKSVQVVYPEKSTYDFYKTLQLRVFKDRTVLIYKSKEIKAISKTTKFLYEFPEPLLLVDDIKASFHNSNLGSKKNCVFYISFNVFGLLQDNCFADDFRSSFGQRVVGDDGDIYWSIKKTLIDMAYKNSGLDPEFEVTFRFKKPSPQDKTSHCSNGQARAAIPDRFSKDSSLYQSMNKTDSSSDSSSSSSSDSCDQMCEAASNLRLDAHAEKMAALSIPPVEDGRSANSKIADSNSEANRTDVSASKGDVSTAKPVRADQASDSGAAAAIEESDTRKIESAKSDKNKAKNKTKTKKKKNNKKNKLSDHERSSSDSSSGSDEEQDGNKKSKKKSKPKLKLIPKILKMPKF